ncbi:MAG: sulfur carrier protein ThiS [Candidatus Anammoximicrobium sp.]|nr:sulfur carrier protein ThiS [Candidatus Anammoximicrobium sp.]
MTSFQINGQPRRFAPEETPSTLAALLQKLGVAPATVVAEVDGRIVSADQFASTPLSDGQAIELIKLVGGG